MNSGYYLKESFKSIFKNKGLSLASIGVVMVSLFILGFFLLLIVNADKIADDVESDLEITAYLKEGVNLNQSNEMIAEIQKMEGVDAISFVSKETALDTLKEDFSNSEYAMDAVAENNPLPDTLHITLLDADQIQEVSAAIQKMDGVESVQYGQDIVENLLKVTHGARIGGLILVVALTIAAIFLIATTTKLSVYARQSEIEIMKYVGATNGFVRRPFIIEGLILGLVGSLLASAALYLVYGWAVDHISSALSFVSMVNDLQTMLIIIGILVLIGIVIGVIGSFISVRKFLKV